jgi:hypothetical protein
MSTVGPADRTAQDVGRTSVLFHIEQVHTPENCPYGKGGSGSLHDASVDGVEVKGFYGSFMEHTIYLVVEADDVERLNQFLLPGMKVCTSRITPVSERPMPVKGG